MLARLGRGCWVLGPHASQAGARRHMRTRSVMVHTLWCAVAFGVGASQDLTGQEETGRETGSILSEMLQETGRIDAADRIRLMAAVAAAHIRCGRAEAADQTLAEAEKLAAEGDDGGARSGMWAQLALGYASLGRWDRAVATAKRIQGQESDDTLSRDHCLGQIAVACAGAGEGAEAERIVALIKGVSQRVDVLPVLIAAHIEAGQREKAGVLFKELLGIMAGWKDGSGGPAGRAALEAALVLCGVKRGDWAVSLVSVAAALNKTAEDAADCVFWAHDAMVANADEDWGALECIGPAVSEYVSVARRAEAGQARAESLLLVARMLLVAGKKAEAGAILSEVVDLFIGAKQGSAEMVSGATDLNRALLEGGLLLALVKSGRYSKALALADRFDPVLRREAYLTAATECLAAGDKADAKQTVMAFLRNARWRDVGGKGAPWPSDAKALPFEKVSDEVRSLAALGRLSHGFGDKALAEELLKRAKDLISNAEDDEKDELTVDVARAFAAAGNVERARGMAQDLAGRDGGRALAQIAEEVAENNAWEAALGVIEMINGAEAQGEALAELARRQLDEGQRDGALKVLERAVALAAGLRDEKERDYRMLALARLYDRAECHDQVRCMLAPVLEREGDQTEDAALLVAWGFVREGRPAEAWAVAKKIKFWDPLEVQLVVAIVDCVDKGIVGAEKEGAGARDVHEAVRRDGGSG